jgi:hypothetical protein
MIYDLSSEFKLQILRNVSLYTDTLPIGGCDATLKAAAETDLLKTLEDAAPQFDYDILVNAVFIYSQT